MNIQFLKEKIDKKIAHKELLEDQLSKLKDTRKILYKEKVKKEKALILVKDVASKTQNQLAFHLSDMVSAGLNTVFDEPYDFYVNFESKERGMECDLLFKKGKKLIDPLKFSGLGAVDIAAFALRCASWSMARRFRPVLLLDEPMKHLSLNHHEKAGKLIKMLSKELNLQIIMNTHSEKIASFADRIFKTKMKNKVSKVKQIQ